MTKPQKNNTDDAAQNHIIQKVNQSLNEKVNIP